MSLYLYAIVDGLSAPDGIEGIAGEPLEVLSLGGLSLVAGHIAEVPPVAASTLAAQDAMVRALHDRAAALLPFRFGTVFASDEDATRAIAPRTGELRERLALVRDGEQMTLRITRHEGTDHLEASAADVTGPALSDGAGTRYLHARAAAARPPEIAAFVDAVTPLVRSSRVDAGRSPQVVATAYHLIARGASGEYRAAIEREAARHPQLGVHVSGPSPCYAFA